jgi:hypothetical protein
MLEFLRKAFCAVRDGLSDLYEVLSPCRYSVIILLVGAVAFGFVPQGQDVLRRMAEWEGALNDRGALEMVEVLGRLALFFLAVLSWAFSTWYWARVILSIQEPGDPPDSPRRARLRKWVPRALGTLALLAMAFALWSAGSSYVAFEDELPVNRLRWMAFLCLLLAVVFLGLVSKRRDMLEAAGRRRGRAATAVPQPEARFPTLSPGTRRWAGFWLAVSIVLGFLFTFAPIWSGQLLGTVPIVLITGATWVLFGTALLYGSRRARVPLLLLLILLAVVFSRWNDNHAIRLADGSAVASAAKSASFEDHFREWRSKAPGRPIFVVAAEGGGIRAAYWTALTLGRLHEIPGFTRQVFAISGVSGGSLGGAVFTALIAEEREARSRGESLPCGTVEDCADQILREDFLSPTVAKMIAPDLAQRFFPLPVPFADRAWALEDSWADAWRDVVKTDRFEEPFLSLWQNDPERALPALVLNGTHVESGRRVVTTNLPWRRSARGAVIFRDTYDLLEELASDLPIKTAVHNSARFTYISPAGTVWPAGERPRGHVVDGGYFENSGAATAQELVEAISQICRNCNGQIYVLYLRNSPETDPDVSSEWMSPEGEEQEGSKELDLFTDSYPRLNEVLSPPRALLNTRNARGSLAVVSLSESSQVASFFQLGLCERDSKGKRAPLPLGWQLSETARDSMKDQLDQGCPRADNPKIVWDIEKILHGPGGPPEIAVPVPIVVGASNRR